MHQAAVAVLGAFREGEYTHSDIGDDPGYVTILSSSKAYLASFDTNEIFLDISERELNDFKRHNDQLKGIIDSLKVETSRGERIFTNLIHSGTREDHDHLEKKYKSNQRKCKELIAQGTDVSEALVVRLTRNEI